MNQYRVRFLLPDNRLTHRIREASSWREAVAGAREADLLLADPKQTPLTGVDVFERERTGEPMRWVPLPLWGEEVGR